MSAIATIVDGDREITLVGDVIINDFAPPPEPLRVAMICVVGANLSLNVRAGPSTNAQIIGSLKNGDVIQVYDTLFPDGNVMWRQIASAGNPLLNGGYAAEKQGNAVYLELHNPDPAPPPAPPPGVGPGGYFQPALHQVVMKSRQGVEFPSIRLREGNDRQQSGANVRRGLYITRDQELVNNGGSEQWAVENMNRMNAKDWSSFEPMHSHILRVYLNHSQFGANDHINAMLEMFARIRQHYMFGAPGDETPLIRLLIVLTDSIRDSKMYFPADDMAGYHNGPLGHLDFWKYCADKQYLNTLVNWAEQVIPAVLPGNEDLIFGWQIMNEPQLPHVPRLKQHTDAAIAGLHDLAKRVWNLTGGQHPVMTGLRTTHDLINDSETQLDIARRLYSTSGDGRYLTAMSGNWYMKDNWPAALNPAQTIYEYAYHMLDWQVARETKRPYLITEFGTRHAGYAVPGPQRDEFLANYLDFFYQQQKAYAVCVWALSSGQDIGVGSNREGLTWSVQGQAVESTPGAFNVWKDHGNLLYNLG